MRAPIAPNPSSIIAQAAGSGVADPDRIETLSKPGASTPGCH
jgi:hypothetical protein